MKIVRLDVHRPSAIVPADYDFVAFGYQGGPGLNWDQAYWGKVFRAHQLRTGGKFSDHEHGGSCHVCGAHAIYTVIFYHRPSNTYIRTGNDCAQKMEFSYDGAAFRRFVDEIKALEHAKAGKLKAQGVLREAGLEAAWEVFTAPAGTHYEETTIQDIVGKLVRYGSVSDKQLDFVRRLLGKIGERANIEARRAVEHEAALPVPEGRVQVTGVILSEKTVDTNYGPTRKMLVKADEGYKVWGTFPRWLQANKGDRVTFVATLEKSKDDAKFGFFSRPTGAKLLAEGACFNPNHPHT